MSRVTRQGQQRRLLDSRFKKLRPQLTLLQPPIQGWVRAIREALGMSQADLAHRMTVHQTSVDRLERNERAGTAQLDTLRRAAEALDCDLVYALVPRHGLTSMVEQRLAELAAGHVAAVEQTMLLEDQLPSSLATHRAEIAEELARSGRRIWRARGPDG